MFREKIGTSTAMRVLALPIPADCTWAAQLLQASLGGDRSEAAHALAAALRESEVFRERGHGQAGPRPTHRNAPAPLPVQNLGHLGESR
ncbi:hypothetical protein ACIQ6R_35250 [Streptomyces sp. NPDC096048]|uniref:hypothetical protein n=1 Tax=Streptomyces sp. NPDC096048 TaxID=3366072 RepID=UPI003814F613